MSLTAEIIVAFGYAEILPEGRLREFLLVLWLYISCGGMSFSESYLIIKHEKKKEKKNGV